MARKANFISIMKHCVCVRGGGGSGVIIANSCIWLQIPLNNHTLAAHSIMICSAVSSVMVFSRPEARNDSKGQQLRAQTANHATQRRDSYPDIYQVPVRYRAPTDMGAWQGHSLPSRIVHLNGNV